MAADIIDFPQPIVPVTGDAVSLHMARDALLDILDAKTLEQAKAYASAALVDMEDV